MPPNPQLTTGCMELIMTGTDVDKPVLQILGSKKIQGGESERYRLLVSDGLYLNSFAMLATQLNDLCNEGKLAEFTIIQIDRYITSMVNKTSDKGDKRVLIILELSVLKDGADVGQRIGNPTAKVFTGESSTNNNASSASSSKPIPKPVESKPTMSYNNNSNSSNKTNSSMGNTSINFSLTYPISSLSPYQNKWVIKARIMSKSNIRTWSNAKGEGKLFSFDVMDESGEIRCTAFKEQCDKFYDVIEVDKVYFISKCQLKPANKQFSSLKNDYEMTCTFDTVIEPCEDDDNSSIPEVKYDFVPISQIANIEAKASVDIIGICRDIGELSIFTSKTTNKEFKKRELTIIDTSDAAVQLALWGDDAVNFEGHVQPVILVKGARVSEFNGGKGLNLSSNSVWKINPDIPEGHKLRGWFDNGGGSNISNLVSARIGGTFNTEWLTFLEAQRKNFGAGDKPDYFQCKAVIHIIKTTGCVYKACIQENCNKKVVEEDNGFYRCEKCNAAFPDFKYRLLLNMSIGDWTTNRWVTCFNEQGEIITGKTAQEIGEANEASTEAVAELLSPSNFRSFIFKLRVKNEIYGDMNRTKYSVVAASPINHKEYNKYLINNIKEATGVGK